MLTIASSFRSFTAIRQIDLPDGVAIPPRLPAGSASLKHL
jgi:hypothetical protein